MIHHNFGSRKLIKELHSLGYCVLYDEILQFFTSVALDQKHEGVFVPRGLHQVDDSTPVDTVIDILDQNKDTLDGKSTTHAMAAVAYRRSPVYPLECRVPRVPQKSLSAVQAFNINDNTDRYVLYIHN